MPWQDYFAYNFEFLPLAAGTANALPTALAFSTKTNRLQVFSDFQALRASYTYTDARVYLKLRDSNGGRYYTSSPAVDARLYCGSVISLGPGSNALIFKNLAAPLGEEGLLRAGSAFSVDAADFSGSSNNVRIALHGNKIYPGNPPWADRKYRFKVSFSAPIFFSLSGNEEAQGSIVVDDDADWFIYRVLATRTAGATLQITQGASEAQWFNSAIHIDNFTGNVAGYNILTAPKYLPAKSVLLLDVTDLSGSTNVVGLQFDVVKKYLG
jgi:hypothetical protein